MPCHANKTVTNCVLAMYGTCFYNTVFDHCIFHFMQAFFLHKEQGTMLILDPQLIFLTYFRLQGYTEPFKTCNSFTYEVDKYDLD